MRRTSHQHGSLKLADRRKGKVWEFRWREVQIDGSVCRKNIVVGTLEDFPNESAAQSAVDAIRLTINRQTPQQLLKNVSVETLVKHYQEHELPDIFSKQKPATGSSDEHHKSYSTQYAYDIYLKKWVLPRWRSYRLSEVKAVDVEAWLKTMPLARGSRAKIRNLMSALFSHAIRWEWTERNPIKSVRQSAKRMRTPDVLTPDEIMALLKELPEPLRTAAELDAFTGLLRGELIGLQWEDVDFENLVIHVRRSVVMMVQGAPKTEASAKDVPLDAALAESLLKLRLVGPYNRETDWEFASPTMKGKQPLWPRNPSVTIRTTGSEGGEDPQAGRVPHLPAHVHNFADSKQRGSEGRAGAPTSCEQSHYAGSLRSGGNAEQAAGAKQTGSDGAQQGRGTCLTGPNWTMTEIANSLQVLERIGGDDGTRTRGLCRDRAGGVSLYGGN
jgi:integrase